MSETPPTPSQQVSGSTGVSSPAFQGLLWTQALTAVNDNVFRWFVIGIGKTQFQAEEHPTLLAIGSALFLIPYILFASVAGWMADRFKKSHVILGCKFAEIGIMSLGVFAVSLLGPPNAGSISLGFWVMLGAVFMMGTQSALFAPSKMGTIPELLNEEQISAGNGVFALTTLSATIVGTGIGGWLADATVKAWGAGGDKTTMPALVMIGIAVVGTALAFLVRSLPAANKLAKFPYTLVVETWRDIKELAGMGRLFRVALGIIFFWSIAGLAQLNIDVLSSQSGGYEESHRTPLLIAVTLGIGIGSVFAGYISAGKIRLGLVPWGAIGMAIFCIALFLAPPDFITGSSVLECMKSPKMIVACLFLGGLGFSAGVFDVPLAAYLQHHSPIESRGSILAATNCLAFLGILILTGLFALLQWPMGKGSLANLPAEYSAASLSEAEVTKLDDLTIGFEKSWDAEDPKANKEAIKQAVEGLPESMQRAAISKLVKIDAEKSLEIDKPVSTKDYSSSMPGSLRQIQKVVVQSGKLPLLTSRQIFLLMGLMTIPVIIYARRRVKVLAAEG